MESQPNKEQVYDGQINPLMAQIIEICRTHNIAFVASFAIPTEDDETLACTSALLTAETGKPQHMLDAFHTLRHGRRSVSPLILHTENADGSATITAIAG